MHKQTRKNVIEIIMAVSSIGVLIDDITVSCGDEDTGGDDGDSDGIDDDGGDGGNIGDDDGGNIVDGDSDGDSDGDGAGLHCPVFLKHARF